MKKPVVVVALFALVLGIATIIATVQDNNDRARAFAGKTFVFVSRNADDNAADIFFRKALQEKLVARGAKVSFAGIAPPEDKTIFAFEYSTVWVSNEMRANTLTTAEANTIPISFNVSFARVGDRRPGMLVAMTLSNLRNTPCATRPCFSSDFEHAYADLGVEEIIKTLPTFIR